MFWIALILILFFRFLSSNIEYKNGQEIFLSSTVHSEPTISKNNQIIKINRVVVLVPLSQQTIEYGDYLEVKGIYNNGFLNNLEIVKYSRNENDILNIRKKALSFIQKALPPPHNGLLAGIIFGSKANISENFKNYLRETGTSHVVVASGMNVSLIAQSVLHFAIIYIPRRKAVIVSTIFTWIFILFAGFEAPLIRAGVMQTVVFSAQIFGRVVNLARVFLLTLFGMLIFNPLWIFDVGFVLSFMATFSLMFFYPKIYTKLRFVPVILREGFASSLAASILVTPVIYVVFKQISVIGPFVNGIVLWVIPIVSIIGLIGTIVSLVLPPLGNLILLLVYPFTWWFVTVINLAGRVF